MGPHTASTKACGRRHIHIIIAVVAPASAVAVVFVIFIARPPKYDVVASLKATAGIVGGLSPEAPSRCCCFSYARSSSVRFDAALSLAAEELLLFVCVCLPVERVRGRL